MMTEEKMFEALDKATDAVLDGAPVEQGRANYLKTMRAATRLKHSLVADTVITRNVKKWRKTFDTALANKQMLTAPTPDKALKGRRG